MKRIVTMQDISCVGKCALTVALPIISNFGIEACPLPTALLSNHTAFDSFKFFDLSKQMEVIIEEFKKQNFSFDGIYSAYLGSEAQVDIVIGFIDSFKKEGTLTLVDPVMGDHGRLYSGFDKTFPSVMKRLCSKADIIVPNVTEAGFLLGLDTVLPYTDFNDLKSAMKELCKLGPEITVITGVEIDNKLGAAIYNSKTNEFDYCLHAKIQRTFHGTGDIFASVLFSCLIKEMPLKNALHTAVNFTCNSMEATLNNENANWYGVDFETVLPTLFNKNDFT